jgi:hypothetical protein
MSRSTDLAIWHGSTGACQQRLTGKPDLRLNGGIWVVFRLAAFILRRNLIHAPHDPI